MYDDGIKRGKAAEHVFVAKCLLNGYDVYLPINGDGRVDVIVNTHRVQVKCVRYGSGYSKGCISSRKSGKRSNGEVKSYKYTSNDVDFLVGVNTNTFDVYIVPVAYAERYAGDIAISKIVQSGYVNNFELLK